MCQAVSKSIRLQKNVSDICGVCQLLKMRDCDLFSHSEQTLAFMPNLKFIVLYSFLKKEFLS